MSHSQHHQEKSHRAEAIHFWVHGLTVLALLTVAMFVVTEKLGWLEPLERTTLDAVLRWEQREPSDDIAIVAITNDDYKTYFHDASPLDPCVVRELIQRVADALHPTVIGVDLDTSSEKYADVSNCKLPDGSPAPWTHDIAKGTPVIYAVVPEGSESAETEGHAKLSFEGGTPRVLGVPAKKGERIGLPLFPSESDGAVRRYRSEYAVNWSAADKLPSLPTALAEAYGKSTGKRAKSNEDAIIHFGRSEAPFPVIEAGEFLHDSKDQNDRGADFSRLQKKLILIGGMYSAARDRYRTPAGELAGVELIAHSIDSDLHSGGIVEASTRTKVILDVISGLLILATYFVLRKNFRLAFWASLVEVPAFSIAASLVAFHVKTYSFNFAPIVVGMIIHQLFETSHKHHETLEELHEAKERICELEKELQFSRPAQAENTTVNYSERTTGR